MIIVAMVSYGGALGMFNSVLAPVWVPVGCAVALSAALMFWTAGMWRRFTGIRSGVANVAVGMVVSVGVMFAGITGLNFVRLQSVPAVEVKAAVVNPYSTKHYHTRRVRKNVYVKGSPYWRYHVRVRIPDGREKTLDITAERYRHLSRRRSVAVDIRHGFLGMDIISLKKN